MSPRVMLLALAACASQPAPAPVAPPPPAPARAPGVLETGTKTDHDVAHIYAVGTAVPLSQIPGLSALGLPLRGSADIDVDLQVPIVGGHEDYAHASGHAKLVCTGECTVGDDVARLEPKMKNPRNQAFAGEGIYFGHLTFTKLDLEGVIGAGHADITRWVVESPDVALQVALHVELAPDVQQSQLAGCIRFKATEALAQRDPKTSAMIATTGAPLAPDGMFTIKLAGKIADVKRLGEVCGPQAN